MSAKDLACLPESLQAIARVSSNGEASWPLAEATAVINALAQADRIVLGLDIREYDDDERFIEYAWSAVKSFDGTDDVDQGRNEALAALHRAVTDEFVKPESWVLVAWATHERLAELSAISKE